MESNFEYTYAPLNVEVLFSHKKSVLDIPSPYHRHDGYELYLFLQGNVHYYVEQSCYHLTPGDLLVVNPSEMHRTVCLDNTVYERIFLNIKRSGISRFSSSDTNLLRCFDARPFGHDNLIHFSHERFQELQNIFTRMESFNSSMEYGNDVLFHAELAKLLVLTNQAHAANMKYERNIMPKLIQKVMNDINLHLTDSITLQQLSQKHFLNGTYISRLFKQHTGLTLRSYILDRRIYHARKLLEDGGTITEACYQSGFSDYANFIRSFTKVVGISPGKYSRR